MYPGGQMIWMAVGWMVVVAAGAAVIWGLLTVLNAYVRPRLSNQSPEQLLKERLTHGDIDAEEYEERATEISKHKRAA